MHVSGLNTSSGKNLVPQQNTLGDLIKGNMAKI